MIEDIPEIRRQKEEGRAFLDVTKVAKEVGIVNTVWISKDVYADCVDWSDEDNKRTGATAEINTTQANRLWDLLWTLFSQILTQPQGDLFFSLRRIPREGKNLEKKEVSLKAVYSLGGDSLPIIIVVFPDEI